MDDLIFHSSNTICCVKTQADILQSHHGVNMDRTAATHCMHKSAIGTREHEPIKSLQEEPALKVFRFS